MQSQRVNEGKAYALLGSCQHKIRHCCLLFLPAFITGTNYNFFLVKRTSLFKRKLARFSRVSADTSLILPLYSGSCVAVKTDAFACFYQPKRTTVKALVNERPRDSKKMFVTGAGRLPECKSTDFVWELKTTRFCEGGHK